MGGWGRANSGGVKQLSNWLQAINRAGAKFVFLCFCIFVFLCYCICAFLYFCVFVSCVFVFYIFVFCV